MNCYCGNELKSKRAIYCSRSCMSSAPEVIQKRKESTLKKYGVDSFSKIQKFSNWSEETKKSFREKSKITFNKKYGVDHHSQTKEYLEKTKKTNTEKYSVDNTFKLVKNPKPYFSSIAGKNWLKTNNPAFSESSQRKRRITRFLNNSTDKVFIDIVVEDNKQLFQKYIHNIASRIDEPDRVSISAKLNVSVSYLNLLFRIYGMQDEYNSLMYKGVSNAEREIKSFIESFGLIIERTNRSLLSGLELDLYIAEKKLAIEYNGVYWHSESFGKDSKYHLNKTKLCEKQQIQLLQIYDTEWNDPAKKLIWKSIIKAKLGIITNKIYARNCQVKDVSVKEARIFLDNNHLDGFIGSEIHKGLYLNSKLVSVISIGKSRFKENEYEIIRFASILDTVVVGGFTKLLSKVNVDNLVSYADRRLSYNSIYSSVSYKKEITGPSWKGFNRKEYALKHRLFFTKDNLKKQFSYDETKTVYDNMLINGYDRIWDSGNIKYYIDIKKLRK